jgi:malate dehydrogenase (oxaloacetate-decarboxylating)(NADP+)
MEKPRPAGFLFLNDPHLNKGTAYTHTERDALGITGLLPDAVEDIELQLQRALQHLGQKSTDLERYIYLIALFDRNETLFYRLLTSNLQRFLPIIYAPTVGEACLKYGHIFRRPHGMYISIRHKGRVREVLRNWPQRDVRFICVSTGGRVLGLGDLGANGMGILVGKLQLYTACAGIPPKTLLPLLLDIGTTNETLLSDPLYLGIRQSPPPIEELDAFVEEFINAVQEEFPHCCIHFEDWKGTDAIRMLARYRDRICCYNDDIQGTGAVALAGLVSAMRITGGKLKDQRILFLGAGSAAIGISDMLTAAMQIEGLSEKEARSQIALFNRGGLVDVSRQALSPEQRVFAQARPPSKDLVATIDNFKPSILIGVSTKAKAFNQNVVEAMGRVNARPIIFALSNPTDHAECTAEEAYTWSNGRAIFASGVQFPPVHIGDKTFLPGQANNFYVFPGMCLGVYATRARRITDKMWIESAYAIANQMTEDQLHKGMLFPPQNDVQEVEIKMGAHIAGIVFDQGLAQVERPKDIGTWLRAQLYKPVYGITE